MSDSENIKDTQRPNAYNIIKRLQRALDDMLTAIEALEAEVMHLRHENENLRQQLQLANNKIVLLLQRGK